ncbi:hypothetical protein OAT07_05960 [Candidatus Pelagibacter sp.]|nr:hypothetical protein [Candidatus Pelagibacter sp.]
MKKSKRIFLKLIKYSFYISIFPQIFNSSKSYLINKFRYKKEKNKIWILDINDN